MDCSLGRLTLAPFGAQATLRRGRSQAERPHHAARASRPVTDRRRRRDPQAQLKRKLLKLSVTTPFGRASTSSPPRSVRTGSTRPKVNGWEDHPQRPHHPLRRANRPDQRALEECERSDTPPRLSDGWNPIPSAATAMSAIGQDARPSSRIRASMSVFTSRLGSGVSMANFSEPFDVS